MSDLYGIFKSYDIRGTVGTQLSQELVNTVGQVFADWLPEEGIVAIGYDMRPDSADLAQAFIEGLISQGRTVWNLGLITSDMAYFAVGKWDLAGAAVMTASHNTGNDNGIKLYRDKVTPVGLSNGLDEIRGRSLQGKLPVSDKTGSVENRDITKQWIDHCLTFITDLPNFNIAVDAGNGMAGAVLPHILPKLPVTAKELYFDLDGRFPNHEANPMKPETLKDLSAVVTSNKLDFGIAFDADGDRAGFVDDLGRPVLGTDLISIAAKLYLQKYPGSKIVHDVRTSRATQELIREWGGTPVRSKAGRVNVGTLLREVGGVFGGETTGHFFFKENFEADSGLITALTAMQAIADSGKKLSQLVDEYRRYSMGPEQNFEISRPAKEIFSDLKSAFPDGKVDMLDGLTINYPDFWFNLRSSNTEPLIRLNVEATTRKILSEISAKVTKIISEA